MIGSVGFREVKIFCIIGVYPDERLTEREISIDLEVQIDFSSAASSDAVENTVDYEYLGNICKRIATEGKYQLLETLADKILTEILADVKIISARVRIEKPGAFPGALCAFVELERKKT